MTNEERTALVSELAGELALRGTPQGTWLVELATVRQQLETAHRAADSLLRRMQDALIREAAEGVARNA